MNEVQNKTVIRKKMTIKYKDTLDHYLQDLNEPSWSSKGLEDLFSSIEGSKRQKIVLVLKYIDYKFSPFEENLTEFQFNFLRQVTLFNYYDQDQERIIFQDLDWLIKEFQNTPTPIRATMIVMLVLLKELETKEINSITRLLKDSPAKDWINSGPTD
jgi:hypothetical protein